ncbi:MAG TPA: hypothetical protein VNQ79_22550 [Blastocatellia bacterium]|nr:hypothetical protein [Blastocatellia bacterium]
MTRQILRASAFTVLLLLGGMTALAGPPLICHPFEIGNAKSLPWGAGSEWRALKSDYDSSRLVEDTLALLAPDTPVIVRMETMRRAAIYAIWSQRDSEMHYKLKNASAARELLDRLLARTRTGKADALALFDAGYFAETWKNAADPRNPSGVDGYSLVQKAIAQRSSDGAMEFAAALITSMSSDKTAQRAHLQKAVNAAPEGSLLARNLVLHFGQRGQKLADLRASLNVAKN